MQQEGGEGNGGATQKAGIGATYVKILTCSELGHGNFGDKHRKLRGGCGGWVAREMEYAKRDVGGLTRIIVQRGNERESKD